MSSQANIPQFISKQFNGNSITPSRIIIDAPEIAENGAVVPIRIKEVKIVKPGLHVTDVWIFDDARSSPVAHFSLGPNARPAELATRIKLPKTSHVYVLARLSDGSLISGQSLVRVTIGGCGGGGPVPSGGHASVPYNLHAIRQPAVMYQDRENYAEVNTNGIIDARSQPVSTFSIDVDTGSYSNVRRFLMKQGRLPLKDAVRIEEMINYFAYDYPVPADMHKPFRIHAEMGPNPWNPKTRLLQIGLKGYDVPKTTLPPANLVFLVDVSGSMRSQDKLSLLKSALKLLTHQLGARDRISLVVYAGASGVVLPPTGGKDKARILAALEQLTAGGSTNGGQGIQLAYAMARQGFIPGGINRVILATDGDFNVGLVSHNALIDLIERQRDSGITLTTLGFGTGNYNDRLMEQLADKGNGNYAYIDTLREARKVLVSELSSTLFTIARDVKIQVEFNPAVVSEYRLVGYENRLLKREDFKNDKVDAGDIGAGHTVTALYEVALKGEGGERLEPLRYGDTDTRSGRRGELCFIRLRYKGPEGGVSREIARAVTRDEVRDDLSQMSDNYRFAAAVAAFGQLLRGGEYVKTLNYDRIEGLARQSLGDDAFGYQREFIELVDIAKSLK
jgi:Ca-activated chloride channel family protein